MVKKLILSFVGMSGFFNKGIKLFFLRNSLAIINNFIWWLARRKAEVNLT